MVSDTSIYSRLITDCVHRDARAQHQLYTLFAPAMFKICLRYAPNHSAAQDIFQDAFVKVFQNLHKIQQASHLPGWIKRVFVYTAIDALRSDAKFKLHIDIETAYQLEAKEVGIEKQLAADEIMILVQKLPVRARLVFNLYIMEGHTHKEIAELLSINEGTSKSQLFEAKKALQKGILQQEKMIS